MHAPRVIKADLVSPRTPVYYFVKEAKQGKWKKGFLDEAREHIVIVTTNSHRRGHKLSLGPVIGTALRIGTASTSIGTGYIERNGYRSIGHGFQL